MLLPLMWKVSMEMVKCSYVIFGTEWRGKDEYIKWKRCTQDGKPLYCEEHQHATRLLTLARSVGCPALKITEHRTIERGLEAWTTFCNRVARPGGYIGLVATHRPTTEPLYDAAERALVDFRREYFPSRQQLLRQYRSEHPNELVG